MVTNSSALHVNGYTGGMLLLANPPYLKLQIYVFFFHAGVITMWESNLCWHARADGGSFITKENVRLTSMPQHMVYSTWAPGSAFEIERSWTPEHSHRQ